MFKTCFMAALQSYPDQAAPIAQRCLALFCQVPLALSASSHFAGQTSHLTGTTAPAASSHMLRNAKIFIMQDSHTIMWILHVKVAARAKPCLILLPLHDGDETPNCGSLC